MYCYVAERLAQDGLNVLYYVPNCEDSYLTADRDEIGTGIKGVTKVYDMWPYVSTYPKKNDIDFFYYPDVGYGSEQRHLEALGYRVGGSKASEILEIDKKKFNEVLKSVGLAVPHTVEIIGFDALRSHLEKHEDKWLKVTWKHRGLFESRHHENWAKSEEWFYKTCAKIGQHRHNMSILVQDPIPSDAEVAIDGWRVEGQMVPGMVTGIELKDIGFAGMIVDEMPEVIAKVEDKLSPVFEALGYDGAYGNEIRLGKDGKSYYIDATCRVGRPPGEIHAAAFDNYGEIIRAVAVGEIPKPKYAQKYVAHVLLCSPLLCDEWLQVSYPESISRWIRLAGFCIRDGKRWCIPDGSGETDVVGAAVGTGDSLQEACGNALKHAGKVEAEGIEFKADVFSEINKSIIAAKEYGIDYG